VERAKGGLVVRAAARKDEKPANPARSAIENYEGSTESWRRAGAGEGNRTLV
jgi:hypothetical protein